jgi:hypothetical protein
LHGALDGEFDGFAGPACFVESAVYDAFGELETFVHFAETFFVKLVGVGADGAIAEGIGARLEVGQIRVHEDDALEDLLAQRLFALHGVLVAVFQCLDEDGCAPPSGFHCAIGDLGARVAHVNEGRPCIFDTGVVVDGAVGFEKF